MPHQARARHQCPAESYPTRQMPYPLFSYSVSLSKPKYIPSPTTPSRVRAQFPSTTQP
ncbi:hypothetical protein BDV38DRAFT_238715 [Aspergillus pseudotamarii]|uniref:Uncharacterized protein n=1 Tax=Aspergillus pseudotamarii TaxID=132259 RepID=A0A5N6T4H4_ASPPS|nr:uncharacterized protein BDV38DRAFT_238715 [Aspergillus pseudotamarii]KAE8141111.1 hypothetical protein BDV38DRAFT_238715 [Aspergillus pseudotamarii]